jgi:hypothetical protein
MQYVFDTNSFREIERYYNSVFQGFWAQFQSEVDAGDVFSVKEVYLELLRGKETNVIAWAKSNSAIFRPPSEAESQFVGEIFSIPHFRQLISAKAMLQGTPSADPFLIASAKINNATVVTEEKFKPNAAKIPNVCDHFKIKYVNLEGFFKEKSWIF